MLPRKISFSHNGEAMVAVLIEDRPAGEWRLEEICSICKNPLGDHSFYTTDPLSLLYIHAHCAAASLPTFQSRSLSAELQSRSLSAELQSRRIPQHYFPSTPPPNFIPYPSYNYNNNSYGPPPHDYHHNNQYLYQHYPPPPPYNYHAGYHTPYNQFPHHHPPNYNYHAGYDHTHYNNQLISPPPPPPTSSSSSSVPVWTGLVMNTVVGSLLQAFFSSIFDSTS